jgi:co-chaperonin GroES (HSP10)
VTRWIRELWVSKRLRTLLHDWVRVRLDPGCMKSEDVSEGGIVLTTPVMVCTGVVEKTGPGKRYKDGKYIPTQVVPGDHVAFFAGNMDTKQGRAIQSYVDEDEALVPETALLFVIELGDGDPMPRIDK